MDRVRLWVKRQNPQPAVAAVGAHLVVGDQCIDRVSVGARVNAMVGLVQVAAVHQEDIRVVLESVIEHLPVAVERPGRRHEGVADDDRPVVRVGVRQQVIHPLDNGEAGGRGANALIRSPRIHLRFQEEDDEIHPAGVEQHVVIVHVVGVRPAERVVVDEVAVGLDPGLREGGVVVDRGGALVGTSPRGARGILVVVADAHAVWQAGHVERRERRAGDTPLRRACVVCHVPEARDEDNIPRDAVVHAPLRLRIVGGRVALGVVLRIGQHDDCERIARFAGHFAAPERDREFLRFGVAHVDAQIRAERDVNCAIDRGRIGRLIRRRIRRGDLFQLGNKREVRTPYGRVVPLAREDVVARSQHPGSHTCEHGCSSLVVHADVTA